MGVKTINPDEIPHDTDWEGNNAAFTCPMCQKVFIVSAQIHSGSRECPNCGKSTGNIVGGKKSGGSAYIRYADSK